MGTLKEVGGLTYVTAEEMRRIDQEAIERCGIDVLSLMENAGVATATLARMMMGGHVYGKRVACLAGKGNNGGDGLVASRHLYNWGADITVVLGAEREALGNITSHQLRPIEALNIPILQGDNAALGGFDLLIDALLGYNARGAPREPAAAIIRRANGSGVSILGVDLPSGLDPTTGEPNDPCIAAKATLTLALPKTGFLNPNAKHFVGELYVGDVSIPKHVYAEFSQLIPLFGQGPVVRIW